MSDQKKPGFTPGPWRVMEPGSETGSSTASVCALNGQVSIYSAPLTAETEANAQLIAAAPEMYEVCREVLSEFRAWQGELEYDSEDTIMRPLFDALKAAIGHAEGRNPEDGP